MTANNFDDKRRFHRIFYSAKANLSNDTQSCECEIIDISLKGCLLRFEQPWQQELEKLSVLTLVLSPEMSIVMQVSLSHTVGNAAGFKCEHIDIDSISELRRLVELNLGNSELLERDILALNAIQ